MSVTVEVFCRLFRALNGSQLATIGSIIPRSAYVGRMFKTAIWCQVWAKFRRLGNESLCDSKKTETASKYSLGQHQLDVNECGGEWVLGELQLGVGARQRKPGVDESAHVVCIYLQQKAQ